MAVVSDNLCSQPRTTVLFLFIPFLLFLLPIPLTVLCSARKHSCLAFCPSCHYSVVSILSTFYSIAQCLSFFLCPAEPFWYVQCISNLKCPAQEGQIGITGYQRSTFESTFEINYFGLCTQPASYVWEQLLTTAQTPQRVPLLWPRRSKGYVPNPPTRLDTQTDSTALFTF